MAPKLLCCIGLLAGCASSPSGPLSANDSTAPVPVSVETAQPEDGGGEGSAAQATDLAAYLNAGLPALGQAWTPDAYRRAAVALTEVVAANGISSLPRRGAADGVFDRLTNPENFAALSSKQPLPDRVSLAQGWLSGFSAVARLYLSRAKQPGSGEPVNLAAEQIALVQTLVALLASSVDLHHEQLVQNPDSEGARRAFDQLRGTTGGAVQGALKMLSEREVYRAADRERLADKLVVLVPRMKQLFSPAQISQIAAAVVSLLAAEPKASGPHRALGQLAKELG